MTGCHPVTRVVHLGLGACYGGSWGPSSSAPMSARTHPEKKWAAGTNESKDRANDLAAKSRLTGWVFKDATLGGKKNLQVKGGKLGQCIGRIVSTLYVSELRIELMLLTLQWYPNANRQINRV